MAKHGNASQLSAGQFAELGSAVLRALPRDLRPEEAQSWIENSGDLTLALRRALVVPETFTVIVDYAKPVSQARVEGNYDLFYNVTDDNFPVETSSCSKHCCRSHTEEVEVHLVHFDKRMTSDEAKRELDKQGLRPATVQELLALGAQYPDLQRRFSIVALGSERAVRDGEREAPTLWGFITRDAVVSRRRVGWESPFRFAAVSK